MDDQGHRTRPQGSSADEDREYSSGGIVTSVGDPEASQRDFEDPDRRTYGRDIEEAVEQEQDEAGRGSREIGDIDDV